MPISSSEDDREKTPVESESEDGDLDERDDDPTQRSEPLIDNFLIVEVDEEGHTEVRS